MQGIPIATVSALALSTTESSNQVQATYDYIGAGTLFLYARGSDATVRVNLFVAGQQILRRSPTVFTGTAGALDTSAHLISMTKTLGGRVELTFVATTGTPTVDAVLSFDSFPLGGGISRLFGRR